MDALVKLPGDRECYERLYGQLLRVWDVLLLAKNEKDVLREKVLEVISKIDSVRYHQANLARIISESAQRLAQEMTGGGITVIDKSTGAENEFEAALIQAKATLDILAKILIPLTGGRVNCHTYGSGGAEVCSALENNLPADLKQRSDRLVELIWNNIEWVERWVHVRNRVTHQNPVASSGLVAIMRDGKLEGLSEPVLKGSGALRELIDKLAVRLIDFVEDFLAFAYRLRIPVGLELVLCSQVRLIPAMREKYVPWPVKGKV